MGKGYPSGIRAARKLHIHRRTERWADKHYNKTHSAASIKANVLGGATMAKGIVTEKIGIGVESKQPNSAIRKCIRCQLIKNGKKITAFVPRDVLIAGFGRSGHAVGDIPGVRFKVVCVSKTSLLALFRGKKEKPHS
ncbi:hypothetical protein WA158_003161 [Blastocystis sp. Blastoise]